MRTKTSSPLVVLVAAATAFIYWAGVVPVQPEPLVFGTHWHPNQDPHWVAMAVTIRTNTRLNRWLVERGWAPSQGLTLEPDDGYGSAAAQWAAEAVEAACGIDVDPVPLPGDVRGPSASLAGALASADQALGGAISTGRVIAVTGAVEPGGYVAPIAGLEQKIQAALDAEADLLVVPELENLRTAEELLGGRIPVVGVASVADAIETLSPGTCGGGGPQ